MTKSGLRSIPSSGTIEIGMDWEWAAGRGNAQLKTEGLGPCIGIATYDVEQKIGHIAHFPVPEASDRDVTGFLDSVLGYNRSIKNLNFWLRGGSVDIEPIVIKAEAEPVVFSLESRKYILEKLLSIGIEKSQVDVKWASSDESVGITLDCANGTLETEITYMDSAE